MYLKRDLMKISSISPLFSNILSQKVLIMGETGVGKTTFTFKFLKFLIETQHIAPSSISILDFAPPRFKIGEKWIGGTLDELIQTQKHLDSRILQQFEQMHWIKKEIFHLDPIKESQFLTPRLSAQSAEEVIHACCKNFNMCIPMIHHFLAHSTPILIINDVGIFLHVGGIHYIKKMMNQANTVLLNAYFGQNLIVDKGSHISEREVRILHLLSKYCTTFLCKSY